MVELFKYLISMVRRLCTTPPADIACNVSRTKRSAENNSLIVSPTLLYCQQEKIILLTENPLTSEDEINAVQLGRAKYSPLTRTRAHYI